MKYFIAITLLLCSFSSSANYVLETIDTASKDEICGDKVKIGDTITVLSNGGELIEARNIGKCVRDKKIKLVVMKALSAASFLVLFGDDVCLLASSDIGTHTPYNDPKNVKVDETRGILQAIFIALTVDAKIKPEHALQYVGYMFLIPSEEMGAIPHDMYKTMLGNKYKGICK